MYKVLTYFTFTFGESEIPSHRAFLLHSFDCSHYHIHLVEASSLEYNLTSIPILTASVKYMRIRRRNTIVFELQLIVLFVPFQSHSKD